MYPGSIMERTWALEYRELPECKIRRILVEKSEHTLKREACTC